MEDDPAVVQSASLTHQSDAGALEAAQQLHPMVSVGPGLAAMSKKMVARILAGEYVDFGELPPAKGKSRSPQSVEGQVIVVQAADLVQTRKLIPDLATWTQCFSLYVATLARKYPEKVPELMAYQTIVAKASLKYRWPSWLVYDQNFRQDAAGNPTQSWAKADASIYAQCFTGQALSTENWCAKCQGLDHSSQNCPYRPRKRPWSAVGGASSSPSRHDQGVVCIKYNKFNGDCKFGRECRYLHVCSTCREAHPVSKCKAGAAKPQ